MGLILNAGLALYEGYPSFETQESAIKERKSIHNDLHLPTIRIELHKITAVLAADLAACRDT